MLSLGDMLHVGYEYAGLCLLNNCQTLGPTACGPSPLVLSVIRKNSSMAVISQK